MTNPEAQPVRITPAPVPAEAVADVAADSGDATPQVSPPASDRARTVRMLIDFAAPIAFGLSYFLAGRFGHFADKDMPLLIGTGVLVIVSVVAIGFGLVVEKRIAWMPLIVGGFGIIFGGLTLWLHDTRIIKIKLTLLNLLFGGVLLGGLALKKQPLRALMGEALPLKDSAWGPLSLAYALFFLTVGVTNEILWRTQPEATWVVWKSSLFVVTLIFSACLTPFLMKNMETGTPPTPDTKETSGQ